MLSRRPLAVVTVAIATVALPSAPALAHECFNASRSAQGNAGADHSPRWETLQLADIFADVGLTPAQQAAALDLAAARGIPTSVTIFIGTHTIGTRPKTGEDTPSFGRNGRDRDGRGIDHFFDRYGEQLIQIIIDVGGTPPPIE
jgi:hypothetical protein